MEELGLYDIQNISMINQIKATGKPVVIMCVGTDRHVWDSIGPMTGSLMGNDYVIFGDLNNPVTALNVEGTERMIRRNYPDHLLVVVDASICDEEKYHKQVEIKKGGIKPGEGAGKDLCRIGDYSILYYIHKDKMNEKCIRNPYNGAVKLCSLINRIAHQEEIKL